MINFEIVYNDKTIMIECDGNKTVLALKKKIINNFELKTKYIDLDFKNESPIRGMGKFNLDRGIILRTFDNYKLDRWNLENKMIKCELIEVNDYEPDKPTPIIKKTSSNVYRPPSRSSEIKSGDSYIEENTFSLQSNDDFPPLS